VGAGMSGILMGMKLRAAGIETFTIYEKAETVGGTWRDNTYPGLVCDVPAYLYRYRDEPSSEWSSRYARGPEIQQYFEQVTDKLGLRTFIKFGCDIIAADYRDGNWHIETARGEKTVADVLISACGVLRQPNYPQIEGLDSFAGATFHTARWDHSVDLTGKRVGILGTGSSGVQIVPEIVDQVAKLSVFQRTPQWIVPLPDHGYSDRKKARMRLFPILNTLAHINFGLMFEWTYARAVIGNAFLLNCFERICQRHLDSTVTDPALKAKLQPNYRVGCKRLVFSSSFYPAIQKPNAELVDTAIDRIAPDGVVTADGRLHPLDVLILATGFRAHDYMRPMRVAGMDGLRLDEAWKDGAQAYLTVGMPGFPNFFMLLGPCSPIGNYPLTAIAEMQADYIMTFLRQIAARDIATVQPTRTATAAFNNAVRDAARNTVWLSGCRNWYLDVNGLPDTWPWTIGKFRRSMRRPILDDFDVTAAAPQR
jgi:cation diffusion facilitator CzcD-associated flavoprotein CzcO